MKCPYCGKEIITKEAEIVTWEGKRFHKGCELEYQERKHLYDYICRIFNLKAPGPYINQQIKNFHDKKGLTYLGIERALKYFYEVTKHKDKNGWENKSIGIVPYVYSQAQNYFARQDEINKKLASQYQEMKKTEQIAQTNIGVQQKKKPRYNIDEIE